MRPGAYPWRYIYRWGSEWAGHGMGKRFSRGPLLIERMEPRLLLCGGGGEDGLDDGSPAFRFFCGPLPVYTAPALSVGVGAAAASSGPLSSLPLLHSRPAAAAKLFLDFDGAPAGLWAGS